MMPPSPNYCGPGLLIAVHRKQKWKWSVLIQATAYNAQHVGRGRNPYHFLERRCTRMQFKGVSSGEPIGTLNTDVLWLYTRNGNLVTFKQIKMMMMNLRPVHLRHTDISLEQGAVVKDIFVHVWDHGALWIVLQRFWIVRTRSVSVGITGKNRGFGFGSENCH